ncbi:hypothetical protein P3H80_18735 [Mycolicibacterium septicum]|nr:hypothetical protein [Mycolicibacterium septicum]
MVATALTVTSICVAPAAVADSTDLLRAAVAAARPAACPVRSDPVIDQAAEKINQTTDRWINNTARAVPETNAVPVLQDLGYGGTKAAILSGAATSPTNAIKATLLQGFDKLPDCSYKDFGVSTLYNAKKDMILTTVVLAA